MLSTYSLSQLCNSLEEMSHFVMSVPNDLVEEFRAVIIHENMDISHLIVYAQHVQETRLLNRNRDAKRERPYDRFTSKGRIEIRDKPKFKKRFSNQVSSNVPMKYKDRVPKPMPHGNKGVVLKVNKLIMPNMSIIIWVGVQMVCIFSLVLERVVKW